MEFELSRGMLIPYILSNVFAVFALWLSFRRPGMSKGLLGILFVGAAVFNIYTAFTNPSAYVTFADTAFVPLYKVFILGFFANHPAIIVTLISIGQLYVGLSMMYVDWRFRSGCIGGTIFALAIAPLGIGSAFPSSLVLSLSFLVLLFVTKKDGKLNKAITGN